MDSLYWNSLNPGVKLLRTNKLFWNKYAFKVKLYVPGGNYLSSWVSSMYKGIDAITYVQRRLKQHTSLNMLLLQPYHRHKGIEERQAKIDIHQADPTTLQLLKKAKMETDIQFRVEEPNISLFHNDEIVLQEVVQRLSRLDQRLLEVSGVVDSKHAKSLKPNVILNSKVPYNYKVYLRLTHHVRHHGPKILQYLDTLGKDSVTYPDSLKHELQTRGHGWHTITYFYCNDPGILDFINLICPDACTTNQVYTLVH
jgi:hypothetical protein